jgi:hypothetical protein
MASNLDRFKADLDRLTKLGDRMMLDLVLNLDESRAKKSEEDKKLAKDVSGEFQHSYQRWYTEALAVVRQLIPDRAVEFAYLYGGDGKRKEINTHNYNIQDWLNGVRASDNYGTGKKHFSDFSIVLMRFQTQSGILESAVARFESTLLDISELVRADLFDSELDAALELAKKGFLRGAGAVAGVVLEKHLAQVAKTHSVSIRKQHPAISDLNDALKTANIIDVPKWRGIQRLGDIRNLCDHNKEREPTKDEVIELVEGVQKTIKTIF